MRSTRLPSLSIPKSTGASRGVSVEMKIDMDTAALIARKFSKLAGYTLALAA